MSSSRPTVPGCSNLSGRSRSAVLVDPVLFSLFEPFGIGKWFAANDNLESSLRIFVFDPSICETLCGLTDSFLKKYHLSLI